MDNIEIRTGYLKHLDIGKEVLYLSLQDCKDTGTTEEEIVEATERGMIAYSKREVEMPAKIGIHPQPDSLMHAMPVYIPNEYACGIKWGSNFPGNNRRYPGLTPTNCQIIFNDAETGLPLSIMDATWITEVRTPATSLISIKYGANLDAKTFGMYGCGIQGKANVRMIGQVLKELSTIYIYDIMEKAMDSLIEQCQPLVKAKIVKCRDYEELAKSSEVIVSALPIMQKPMPPVKNEWIQKGQTLICLDCHTAFEDAIYKRSDKYYLDSIEQHELLAGYGYYPYGLPKVTGETGGAAAGICAGRENRDELVIFNNVGMAVEDLMCARMIFDRALDKGLGIKLPLWGSTAGLKK